MASPFDERRMIASVAISFFGNSSSASLSSETPCNLKTPLTGAISPSLSE